MITNLRAMKLSKEIILKIFNSIAIVWKVQINKKYITKTAKTIFLTNKWL